MGISVSRLPGSHLWQAKSSYFSKVLVEVAKTIPGMAWDASNRAWVGYIDAVQGRAGGFEAKGIRIERRALDGQKADDYRHHLLYAVNGADGRVLRDYQKTAVDFLICTAPTGAILSLDMGCGKTAVALMAVRAFGGRTLIIVPSSARSGWADTQRGEILKWCPKARPNTLLLDGTRPGKHEWRFLKKVGAYTCKLCEFTPPLEGDQGEPPTGESPGRKPVTADDCDHAIRPTAATQIVICHYDVLFAWVDVLIAWGPSNIVWDEAHMLQSEKSRRSVASKEIAAHATVKTRAALTGTPLVNRIRDLWNLIDTISPARVGKRNFLFQMRYCDGHYENISRDIGDKWIAEGKSNLEELQKRLARFTMRKSKEEVKLELPPKTRQIIRLEIPVSYRQANVDQVDKRLIQAVFVRAVDGKLPQVIERTRDHLEAGASVVDFVFRRSVAEYIVTKLSATGFMCRFIHGGVPHAKRETILNELREASLTAPVLLVCTIDCCAVAIDLTFASVGMICELTYEPHELLQAESRLHRFGQADPVLIEYPIAMQTIEEAISEVVIDRLDTVEMLIGKTDGLAKALAGQEEDLIAKLGERLLAMTAGIPAKKVKRKRTAP